jgi:hypothetical protein
VTLFSAFVILQDLLSATVQTSSKLCTQNYVLQVSGRMVKVKKDKVHPRTGHESPEGEYIALLFL